MPWIRACSPPPAPPAAGPWRHCLTCGRPPRRATTRLPWPPCRRTRWRREPAGVLVDPPGIDQKAAREVVSRAAPGWLTPSELFGDVATGVTPLTDRDAAALLASLRANPLLTGAAGDHRSVSLPPVS